jgi:hypothetical protein
MGQSWSLSIVKNFLHIGQNRSGAHTASIQWVLGAPSREVKWQGREAVHSPPTSAVVKMWTYTLTPPYAFMALCLIS